MHRTAPSVYIVDDDDDIRETLVQLLSSEQLESVAMATPQEFLAICSSDICGCLLLDLELPQMTGLELQQVLQQRGIDIPVIFLTGHGDVPRSSLAFRSGAFDFLQKPVDNATLLERVREAIELDHQLCRQRQRRADLSERFAKLTPREHDVCKLVAAGFTTKEIAKALAISNRTVDVYRTHLMEKLDAHSLADLVTMALELEDTSSLLRVR